MAASAGTVWVLERASDGSRASLNFSGNVAGAVSGVGSIAAGTAIGVSACRVGWVLAAAGKAIAYVPNEMGRALVYNERITR